MTTNNKNRSKLEEVIDIILKVGVLAVLIAWCLRILSPFLNIVLWAVLIAVTVYPLFNRLQGWLGNRQKLAAGILSFLLLLILTLPALLLADSMIEGIGQLGERFTEEGLQIPPPPGEVKDWPVIGTSLYGTWELASENLTPLLLKYKDALMEIGQKFFNILMGTGIGLVQILISILLAGILLVYSSQSSVYVKNFFEKIAGSRGNEFHEITAVTIRNISKGVLGVAIIQSLVLGLIFYFAGVPYAGLWSLICLILAIIQIGPLPVTLPVVIYLFLSLSPGGAVIWTILIIAGSLVDNILKPILMGKGASVPMLVIFLGAIGGFIANGFVGLFIGAVVLSLGYKLFMTWLAE